MGNRTYALILFVAVWTQLSFSAEVASMKCPAALSSQNMYYCGVKIDADPNLTCVNAKNTVNAKEQCRKLGKTTWRLANKVYHLEGVSEGQFLCSSAPLKSEICQKQGFQWNAVNGSCNFPSTVNSRASHRVACNESATAEINKPLPLPPCEAKDAKWVLDQESSGSCKCENGGEAQGVPQAACNPTKEDPPAEPPTPNAQTQAVVDCTSDYENKLKACKDESQLAVKNCDQNNATNKEVDTANSFVSSIANTFIAKAAGSGARDQCAAASLLSSGSFKILNGLKAKCETNTEGCKSKCSEIQGGVIAACSDKSEQPRGNNITSYSQDQIFLYDANKRLTPELLEAFKLCKVDAAKKEDLLKDSLMVMDNAARSGAQCACELSSNQQDCKSIVGPAECDGVSPTLPGCNSPISLGCALGSGEYSTPKCECMRDPSLLKCKAEPGKVPFAFASDLKAINSGNLSGGASGGSSDGGDLDLGPFNQASDASPDDKSPQGSAPGFGSAAGPGGGGGGGSGGGSGNGDAGAGAEVAAGAEEKNLGLFGMAKSAMSNLFGKGSKAAGKEARSKNVNLNPDAEKWRPRGLASSGCKGSQIRCKNETIWEIMNSRYSSNQNSFIQKP